jgi:phosphoribosylanthranilate isomerase
MPPASKPRVKICCISSIEEAWMAIDQGASALGLVSRMPSGPGVIDETLIAEITRSVPPPIATFLLTSRQDPVSIIDQQKRCGTNTIQLCDRLEEGSHKKLREALPGVALVQVIHVNGEEAIEEALAVAPQVNALLLDSGNQKLRVKELGGTGRTHDWIISKKIREAVAVPVFLGGGLRAENVRQAFEQVMPFAVDVCSGVRTEGKLDPIKLGNFFSTLG